MKKNCLKCDTELNSELLEGFEIHRCPNCNRSQVFGMQNYAMLMTALNRREHQKLDNYKQ